MSFSAYKNIKLSNKHTKFSNYNYANENSEALHKYGTTIVTGNDDYNENNKNNENNLNENDSESIDYIEPYNYHKKIKPLVTSTTNTKQKGYLRDTRNKIDPTQTTYFWVEDFKNWATWRIAGYSPMEGEATEVNYYVLYVWNGLDSFVPLEYTGALLNADNFVNTAQNKILSDLRHNTITLDGMTYSQDYYVAQMRGASLAGFNKPNDSLGFEGSKQIVCSYPLHSLNDYSIYDGESMQTIRMGCPNMLDLTLSRDEQCITRFVRHLTFNEHALEVFECNSMKELEEKFYHKNKEDIQAYFYENKGIDMYYSGYKSTYTEPIFYDPNHNDNISLAGMMNRYFVPKAYYGIPVDSLVLGELKIGSSNKFWTNYYNNIAVKFQTPEYAHGYLRFHLYNDPSAGSKYVRLALATIFVDTQKQLYTDPAKPDMYNGEDGIDTNGFLAIRHRTFPFQRNNMIYDAGNGNMDTYNSYNVPPLTKKVWHTTEEWSGESDKDRFVYYIEGDQSGNTDDEKAFQKKCLTETVKNTTNFSFFNALANGLPMLYRLPTGEIALATHLYLNCIHGLTTESMDFINEMSVNIFGTGSSKTIARDWLKPAVINSNETASIIKQRGLGTLHSVKSPQICKTAKADVALNFKANNIMFNVDNVNDGDYAAKW